MKPRVAILGAGAMGTTFAYHLAGTAEVTLVDVRGDLVDAIEAQGGVQIDDSPVRHVVATRDPARAFATNYLFLFVKAPFTLTAVRPFAGQLNPATPIVSLQNGIGNEEAIKAALGGAVPLIIGVTNVASAATGFGRSRRLGVGSTVLGSAGATHSVAQAVMHLLQASDLDASVVYDIAPHLWGKLIANAAINPVAALLDDTNGVVERDVDAAELAHAVVLEGAAVARAMKIALPFSDPWAYVRGAIAASIDGRNSMTVDLNARAKTEVDQINGAIVAMGRRFDVPTPYNEALLRLVKAKERAVPR